MCDVFRKLTSYFVVIINTKRLYCPFYGRKEEEEGGNTEHDLNVVSGIQLSNHFKPPI